MISWPKWCCFGFFLLGGIKRDIELNLHFSEKNDKRATACYRRQEYLHHFP